MMTFMKTKQTSHIKSLTSFYSILLILIHNIFFLNKKLLEMGEGQSSLKGVDKYKQINVRAFLVGPEKVGKLSIMERYAKNQFSESFQSSTTEFRQRKILFPGWYFTPEGQLMKDVTVKLSMGRATSDKVFELRPLNHLRYYQGVILVYDISKQLSLKKLSNMTDRILSQMKKGAKITLIGNKLDLDKKVNQQMLMEYVKKYELSFNQVSAKTGENVDKVLNEFALSFVKEKLKPISVRDIYMQMLLCLNDDFDDDLLKDAIEMLEN